MTFSYLNLLFVRFSGRIDCQAGVGGNGTGVTVTSGSCGALVTAERDRPVVVGEGSRGADLVAVADRAALLGIHLMFLMELLTAYCFSLVPRGS